MGRSHQHSFTWRVSRAIEHAGANRPLLKRSGPAWAFGILGVTAELLLAPIVLAITLAVGLTTYLLLDAPWTRMRAQQRPRFVSVRILYLNTLIVAGFWLAVMFTFSAADPALSVGVEQRLPALLQVATAKDLPSLITLKKAAMIEPVRDPMSPATTWFDVFLHGLIATLALNFVLFGVVSVRRRQRAQGRGTSSRRALRFDASVGLFVDDKPSSAG